MSTFADIAESIMDNHIERMDNADSPDTVFPIVQMTSAIGRLASCAAGYYNSPERIELACADVLVGLQCICNMFGWTLSDLMDVAEGFHERTQRD